MSKIKESSEKGKAIDLDVDAFQLEIEKEIDTLFVPFESDTEPSVPPVAPVSTAPVFVVHEEEKESPKASAASAEAGQEIDFLFPPDENSPSVREGLSDARQPSEPEIDDELQILFPSSSEMPEGGEEPKGSFTELPPLTLSLDEPEGGMPAVEEKSAPKSAPALSVPSGGMDIDMDAFELQLDKEIDTLFVPAGGGDVGSAPASRSFDLPLREEPKREPPSSAGVLEPAAPAEKPPVANKLGINLQDFEEQVGREIDSLFVPVQDVAEAGQGVAPPSPSVQAPPVPSAEAVVTPPPKLVLESAESAAPPAAMETSRTAGSEGGSLFNLLEQFNIAYLSLDWEFSSENITKLEHALQKLEPFCREHGGNQSLYKIFKAVLQRIKARPDHITPETISLLRDTQELMKTVLPFHLGPGPREKEGIRALILRFQSLKEGDEPIKESVVPIVPPPREELTLPLPKSEEQKTFAAGAPVVEGVGESWPESFDMIRQWIGDSKAKSHEALADLEYQCKRLRQIEELLAKKSSLVPLKTRIEKVRTGIESQLAFFQARENDWAGQIRSLSRFAGDEQKLSGLVDLVKPVETVTPALESSVFPTPAGAVEAPATGRAPEVRQEQVFFFRFSDKPYAVLASQVVKIDQASGKKTQKITSRGFATLNDFKPIFRSLKTGLFGSWSWLSVETLKGYRFFLLPEDTFKAPVFSDEKGVILVSTGRNHGVIFAESSEIQLQNEVEIVLNVTPNEDVLGAIHSETGPSVEVLNLDRILKRSRQSGGGEG